MAIFDKVPRELYESEQDRRITAESRLAESLERYEALVKQIIDIKRHEHGLNPDGFDPATLDPAHGLGPYTLAAIDEFASGDPELRRYLVGRAWTEHSLRHEMEPDSRDQEVSEIIAAGDQD